MSEEEENDVDRRLREGEEALRKKGIEPHEPHFGVEAEIKDELKNDLKLGRLMRRKLEKACIEHNVEFNPNDIEGSLLALKVARAEAKQSAESQVIPEGKGGKGTIPLSMADSPNKEGEYDSYEAMIDELRKYERHGNTEQRKQAKLILNKMTQNFLKSEVSATYDKEKRDAEDETRSILKDLKKLRQKENIEKLKKKGMSEEEARKLVKEND